MWLVFMISLISPADWLAAAHVSASHTVDLPVHAEQRVKASFDPMSPVLFCFTKHIT